MADRVGQRELVYPNPPTIDIDGYEEVEGIRYIGKATKQYDGTWRALAILGDQLLCLVEVKLTPIV